MYRQGDISLHKVESLPKGIKKAKDIKHISSVQFKKAGFTRGYIQFAFVGGQESKAGVFNAVSDENTVMFSRKQQSAFEAVKDYVESIIYN